MMLGLFLEIGGTSSRILNTLSNAGACVSITTIERLKEVLSKDAVAFAVELMQGTGMFYLIFDNINIFLRRSQQRLFNKNSMIHATNAAAIGIPDADIAAEDLTAKLENRGKRAQATGADIMPTPDDEAKMIGSFEGLVMIFILAYCPGSKQWENRDAILKAAREIIASDRPLPPKKSDGASFGRSKKGIVKMLKALQEISGLSETEWASKARIVVGDWLTASNIRGARRGRTNDVNSMERLELQNDIKRWADLAKWKPSLEELRDFAHEFVDTFTLATQAENAKELKDDYYRHSCHFIRDALIFCVYEDGRLHNYARECLEILLQWKYELSPALQGAKEQAMFYNRWGLHARNIPSDLYLEQNNFWVKRVHIAKGSGVTINYIIEKGSACVEAFREVSHRFARTFGFADRARRHKEVDVTQDLRLLTETLMDARLHIITPDRPIYAPLKTNKKGDVVGERVSAIVDSFDVGAALLNGGKCREFIRNSTWDPAVGAHPVGSNGAAAPESDDPLLNESVFDQCVLDVTAFWERTYHC
ncbi:hypothetical protein B0H14DRAFT_3690343 [Mycena olivaceomarginata]|nr:hypothetical protein B0H14DRAFT_3690343 [Mycena olivaceomarginata]